MPYSLLVAIGELEPCPSGSVRDREILTFVHTCRLWMSLLYRESTVVPWKRWCLAWRVRNFVFLQPRCEQSFSYECTVMTKLYDDNNGCDNLRNC